MEKTIGQIIDEINEMNDGSIMEIYKVSNGFKTKHQSGWSHSADEFIKENKTKPLFITEDGIKITEHRTAIILVDTDFTKQYKPAIDCNINTVVATTKLFFHESNADEYIWRNKPVFSYEEIAKRARPTELYYLETLAMERSKE